MKYYKLTTVTEQLVVLDDDDSIEKGISEGCSYPHAGVISKKVTFKPVEICEKEGDK